MKRPVFFEPIRARAEQRWLQLEADAELVGPWRLLFRQVAESPRHVLSELLQNADDADATEASVDINNGRFVFSHNGVDFTKDHFQSLCLFGYSNKRLLHTIGFRGIGFKSTFSLGDVVCVRTPTLSVRFHRERFTEPVWLDEDPAERTEVMIYVKDKPRLLELHKNLEEWFANPNSLLFFRHIRRLRIGDRKVGWEPAGSGPIAHSKWMTSIADSEVKYLVVRSGLEDFPREALDEIRQERMLGDEQALDFPPCRVEIVLGMEGQLYVVLPTGVKVNLPFACDAPFIQDPARSGIKHPSTSPTNRWLLDRIGALAAHGMLEWLRNGALSAHERADAYGLMPDVDRTDSSLSGVCAARIESSFRDVIADEHYLLTDEGSLVPAMGCVALPRELFRVWSPEQIASSFVPGGKAVLNREVKQSDRRKLVNWGVVEELGKPRVLQTLCDVNLPKPQYWGQLLTLWAFVAAEVGKPLAYPSYKGAKVFPVQGKDVLYESASTIRLGDKRLLGSDDDWAFLEPYVLVLDTNLPRFLAEQKLKLEEAPDLDSANAVLAADDILSAHKLNEATNASAAVDQVAARFFARKSVPIADCVRLAQIVAALGIPASGSFRFVTTDQHVRSIDHQIVVDQDGTLAALLPAEWCKEHALHESYTQSFTSCTWEAWQEWVASGRSGLLTFPRLQETPQTIYSHEKMLSWLRARGCRDKPDFPYDRGHFRIQDWDYPASHWQHWQTLAKQNSGVWSQIAERVLAQPSSSWSMARGVKVKQFATNGWSRILKDVDVRPAWIQTLREEPCLRDTLGVPRVPATMMRRTPQTEALMGVEPFVRADLDTEATRPLLDALGVQDTPTGPQGIIGRVRALSKSDAPPEAEVNKWYRSLDRILERASTEELDAVVDAFANERLIFAEYRGWVSTDEVFLAADDAFPEADIVRASVRHLSMWSKIGVAERPTADLAISWLKQLSERRLSPEVTRRVEALLPRYPQRIWKECQRWLNLEGEWVPTEELSLALTMHSLVPWKHLFPGVKATTADLQKLSAEACTQAPFSELQLLGRVIEERLVNTEQGTCHSESREWLAALGSALGRISLPNPEEQERIRTLARRLAASEWQEVAALETVPYIAGAPAGTARPLEAMWKDQLLYVVNRSLARVASAVHNEIGRAFARPEILDAVKVCYERPRQFVEDYLEQNLKLEPAVESPYGGDGPSSKQKEQQVLNGDDKKDLNNGEGGQTESEDGEADEARDNNEDSDEEPGESLIMRRWRSTPAKTKLMQRFAEQCGFSAGVDDRFRHSDGRWIGKSRGSAFPWTMYSPSGDELRSYWPQNHCIESKPLEMESDVWDYVSSHPESCSLILLSADRRPVQITGEQLLTMTEDDELKLYPAAYRLVYKHET